MAGPRRGFRGGHVSGLGAAVVGGTALNTANALVKRGASGQFAAGAITGVSFVGGSFSAWNFLAIISRIQLFGINAISIGTAPPDDWNPNTYMTNTNVLRVVNTSGGNLDINSLLAPYGQLLMIENMSANAGETLTLKHQGTGGYKFNLASHADLVIPRKGAVFAYLDSAVDFFWHVHKGF